MIERQVQIPTSDGDMTTFVCHPERNGPHPLVIFFMDAPGIREELRDMVRRLASVGYYVMLPNLYYRSGVLELGPDAMIKDAMGRSRITPLVATLSIDLIMADSEALLSFATADVAAIANPLGVLGYCMSAQFAINLAARYPEQVTAAASIYGTWLMTDKEDSPHLAARKATAQMYFACAEEDPWMSLDDVECLRRDLAAHGVKAEVELYAQTEHGFAFPSRPAFDLAAAERHWKRIFALLQRALPQHR